MDEFNSKSATTEERISELKNRSEENIQNKGEGWKIKAGISLIQDIIRSSNTCILESPKERRERMKAEVLFKRRMTENAKNDEIHRFKHRYKPKCVHAKLLQSYLAI